MYTMKLYTHTYIIKPKTLVFYLHSEQEIFILSKKNKIKKNTLFNLRVRKTNMSVVLIL